MSGKIIPTIPQLEAAKLLARLETSAASGKKERAAEDAQVAAAGRFGARSAPLKLVKQG